MISKYSHKGLSWIDLESPKEEEITYIFEEYTIPIYIKEDILSGNKDDIIRLDHDFIFAYLNFFNDSLSPHGNEKVIFIICDNYIITIHDNPIKALTLFLKEIELDTFKNEKFNINNNKLLFSYLMKSLFVNSHKQIIQNEIIINNFDSILINKNKKIKKLKITLFALLGITILISIYAISLI
jgi:hypothetical protein